MRSFVDRLPVVAVIGATRLIAAPLGAIDVVLIAGLLDGDELGRWFVITAVAFLLMAVADGGHSGSLVRVVAERSATVRRETRRAVAVAVGLFAVASALLLSGPAAAFLERVELVPRRSDVALSVAIASGLLLRRLATDVARGRQLDLVAALLAGTVDRVALFVALVTIGAVGGDATVAQLIVTEVACIVGALLLLIPAVVRGIRNQSTSSAVTTQRGAARLVHPALWLDAIVDLGALQLGVVVTRVLLDESDTGVFGLITRLAAMVALPIQVLVAYVPARLSVLVARERIADAQRLLRSTSTIGWYGGVIIAAGVLAVGSILVAGTTPASVGLALGGLAVATCGQLINVGVGPVGRVLAAVHRDRWALAGSAIGLAAVAVGIMVLASAFGVVGALAGAALGVALNNLSQWWFLRRTTGLRSDGWSMMRPAEIRSSLRDFDRVAGDGDRPAD